MNARIRALRRQSVEATPHIDTERARIMTEVYQRYEGTLSVPELRAMAFKTYFEQKTLCINPGELIVGEKGRISQLILEGPAEVLAEYDI